MMSLLFPKHQTLRGRAYPLHQNFLEINIYFFL